VVCPALVNYRGDLEDARVVILPVGSFEQHGPYLPYETDSLVACEVAKRLGARLRAPVLPPLNYGVSTEHMGFPGTVTLEPTTLCLILRDILASLAEHGVELVIVVNGHGGNKHVLEACATHWNMEFSTPAVIHTFVYDHVDMQGDKHAGPVESSIAAHILGLKPFQAEGKDCNGVLKIMRTEECSQNGIIYPGPFRASPERGEKLLAQIVDDILDTICKYRAALKPGLLEACEEKP